MLCCCILGIDLNKEVLIHQINTCEMSSRSNERDDSEDEAAPYSKKRARGSDAADDAASWNAMFVRLAVWKGKHQHSDDGNGNNSIRALMIENDDPDDPELARWAQYQRSKHGRAALAANTDRLKALNAMGFCWNLRQEKDRRRFDEHFQQLLDYKKVHGNLLIPTRDHPLSSWVNKLRTEYFHKQQVQSGKLKREEIDHFPPISDEYEDRLNAIGFVWKVKKCQGWDVRVQQLIEYKNRFGDTRVPQHWPENKQLGKWVAKTRADYNLLQQGKPVSGLTEARVAQLNELGFDWGKARPNARKENKEEYGNTVYL